MKKRNFPFGSVNEAEKMDIVRVAKVVTFILTVAILFRSIHNPRRTRPQTLKAERKLRVGIASNT